MEIEGWEDDKSEEELREEQKLIDELHVQWDDGGENEGEFPGMDSLLSTGPIDADTSKPLPPIYQIPGESDEVGSWDELVENAPHKDDEWVDPKGYLRPDEIGDRKLDLLSGLDKLILYITNKIQNAFIYTRMRTDVSRFQAEFVAIATVNGKTYTSTYLTPGYAIGMTDEQAAREGDIIVENLAKNLGIRAFAEKTPHIPDDAFMTFVLTEKW